MKIKDFVKKYNSIATESLKNDCIKNNLHINTYVPFITKVSYATTLVENTMIDKKTGNVVVNSESNYLFFCRSIIELYTDLKIENKAFFEEYDLLNKSGVLDKIMQMIPEKEINEFKMICDMKKDDLLFNQSTPKAFINHQVERVSNILGITLKPVLEDIANKFEKMSDEDIEKLTGKIEKFVKRIK